MPLSVSKTALDRLGSRLAASDPIEEADLGELARVLSAYQEVLDRIKAHLVELGYAATTRVKTTGTLVEKLRRETARLSQVQDLAGARIVVPDRAAQDDAVDEIRPAFEELGCACKVIDRRKNPSHGYRAVHLIVQMDRVPVEIQVRTDLQDTWAQIVERLADRWGRGIRYGEDPEKPDARVRTGVQGITSRREVVAALGRFSDSIARMEEIQAMIHGGVQYADALARVAQETQKLPTETLAREMPPEMTAAIEQLKSTMNELATATSVSLPEDRASSAGDRDVTLGEIMQVMLRVKDLLEQRFSEIANNLGAAERQVRDTLQLIAEASDE